MENDKNTVYIKTKDFLVTGEEFTLLYDTEQEMLVTNPQPEIKNLSKYYESDEYISHTDGSKGFVAFLYQTVKRRALKNKIKLITSLNNEGRNLLDIGAGTGDFLLQAEFNNWNVSGVEPNESARKLAQEKGVRLVKNIDALKKNQYDVITLWHVLEHLPNLKEKIIKIEDLLKPNGTLIVAVPNYRSYDAKHYKNFWAAFDVPRHLWHFSRKSMERLFSKNLHLKKIKPMIFDSYYVSLLSEKNKTGSQNFINAFFIGLRSNIAAWNTKEYSSLIYCFKKGK